MVGFCFCSSNAVFPLTIAHQLTALKFGQFIVLSMNMDWSKLNPLWPQHYMQILLIHDQFSFRDTNGVVTGGKVSIEGGDLILMLLCFIRHLKGQYHYE